MKAFRLSIDEQNNAERFWNQSEGKDTWEDLCKEADKNRSDWDLWWRSELDAEKALIRLSTCPYWDLDQDQYGNPPVLGVYVDDVEEDFFD